MPDLLGDIAGASARDPQQRVRDEARVPQRKRFYADVAVASGDNGFTITLDGRGLKTPAGQPLIVPQRAIADAIAAEWAAQREMIDPLSMPLTRLANSIVAGVIARADDVAADMAKFLESDLVFYRAANPAELVAREVAAWDGAVRWAADTFNAHFILAEGVMFAAQPATAVAAMRAAIPDDPWAIGALHVVTTITGSALLALALWHGALDPETVWTSAHVDDDWNMLQWGVDDEASAKRAARRRDFDAATALLAMLRG